MLKKYLKQKFTCTLAHDIISSSLHPWKSGMMGSGPLHVYPGVGLYEFCEVFIGAMGFFIQYLLGSHQIINHECNFPNMRNNLLSFFVFFFVLLHVVFLKVLLLALGVCLNFETLEGCLTSRKAI